MSVFDYLQLISDPLLHRSDHNATPPMIVVPDENGQPQLMVMKTYNTTFINMLKLNQMKIRPGVLCVSFPAGIFGTLEQPILNFLSQPGQILRLWNNSNQLHFELMFIDNIVIKTMYESNLEFGRWLFFQQLLPHITYWTDIYTTHTVIYHRNNQLAFSCGSTRWIHTQR